MIIFLFLSFLAIYFKNGLHDKITEAWGNFNLFRWFEDFREVSHVVLKADIEYIFIVFEGAFNLEAITLLNSSLLILKNNLLCDVNRSLFTFNLYSFLNLIVRIILHTRVNSQFAGSLHLGLQIL